MGAVPSVTLRADSMMVLTCQHGGQLRSGAQCLSQKGPASGMEDVAARGAVAASSAADVTAHGANMAVDGSSNTFWVGWPMRCRELRYAVVLGSVVALQGQRPGC